MSQTIKIKRSTGSSAPSTLANGELAYLNNSTTKKLYIGRPGGGTGDIDIIGGKYYTDVIDARTANSVVANATTNTSSRTYKVQKDSNDHSVVNVPWVDTNTVYTLPLASSTTRGGVKIGYTESGNNYPVELSSEKMYVNVPWTDTSGDNKLPLAGGTLTGDISFGDNVRIKMGAQTGGDLNIYHDGTNSVIQDRGTGNLQLLANDLEVKNSQGNTFFQTHSDGETTFSAGSSEILKLLVGNDSAVRADTNIRINSLNGKFQTGGVAVADSGQGAEYCFEMFGSTNSSATDHHGNVKVKGGGDLKLTTDSTSKTQVTAGKFQLASGTDINEFSIDTDLAGESDDAVPTEKAVKSYVDGKLGNFTFSGDTVKTSGSTMTLDPSTDGAGGTVKIEGNLTVTGTTTTINSNTVSVGDSIIQLNTDLPHSTTAADGGIEVYRGQVGGDGSNERVHANILWDESVSKWTVDQATGTASAILTAANWGSEYSGVVDGGSF